MVLTKPLHHILLIEDDPDDVDFFRAGMATLSPEITITSVSTGPRAIEYLKECDPGSFPDMIFMDINLPMMNGWECLREIKGWMARQNVPIVMFSAMDFSTQELEPSDVGAAAFMTKPDNLTDLKKGLSSLFASLFQKTQQEQSL